MCEIQIEVEWTSIPSGVTQIDISDLGCENKDQWNSLSPEEQKKRINAWQIENEERYFNQTDWYIIED